jgi:hypothetical protein
MTVEEFHFVFTLGWTAAGKSIGKEYQLACLDAWNKYCITLQYSLAGKTKSEAKSKAARENGKLGGRPKRK